MKLFDSPPIRRGNIRRSTRRIAKIEGIRVRRIQFKKRVMGAVDPSGVPSAILGQWHRKGHRIEVATIRPRAKGRLSSTDELIHVTAHELAHAKETRDVERGHRPRFGTTTHDIAHQVSTDEYKRRIERTASYLAQQDRQYVQSEKHPKLRQVAAERLQRSVSWDEAAHPRDEDGRWTNK